MHFVGVIRAGENALAARDTSFGEITELRFGVLSFRIVAPEALHGASFEEHSCADARAIVQGKALDVENNVSSLHCDTVRRGVDCRRQSSCFKRGVLWNISLIPPCPRQLIGCLLGDFWLIFKAGRRGKVKRIWRIPAGERGFLCGTISECLALVNSNMSDYQNKHHRGTIRNPTAED